MRLSGVLALFAAAALAATLAVRAVQHAETAPFEVDIVLRRRSGFDLGGARLGWRTPSGSVLVDAERAEPASDRLGDFVLGPARYLALSGVEVTVDDGRFTPWHASAGEGELRGHELRLLTDVVVGAGDTRTRGGEDCVIDVRSGAIRGP